MPEHPEPDQQYSLVQLWFSASSPEPWPVFTKEALELWKKLELTKVLSGEQAARVRQAVHYLHLWHVSHHGSGPAMSPQDQTGLQPNAPWLRRWQLLGYLLDPETRARVFGNSLQELLEDYALARRQYTGKWERRWLNLCFTIRAVRLVWQSLRAMLGDRVLQCLLRLAPELVKWWLTR